MNVSEQITNASKVYPTKISVVSPINNNQSYKSYSFKDLESRINQFSNKLTKEGVKNGDKVLLFIKPNIDFAAIVFSVFRIGAIGVFIDPGMGKDKLLDAIEESKANVLIGIDKVHVLRRIFKKRFKHINLFFTNSKYSFFAHSIYKNINEMPDTFNTYSSELNDTAALLYTSGGTGKPKGVVYTHSIFIEQTKKLQTEFSLTHEDVDLAGFPLFAMFTLSMGMTSVIPFMDPSKPAKAKGVELLKNIKDHKVTFVGGSPAIWSDLLNVCLKDNETLDSVKYFVMFGAPIPYSMHERFFKILPHGTTYTPYGATECLPVSNISGNVILKEFLPENIKGKGICIGKPLKGVDIKIIKPSKEKIFFSSIEELNANEVGEIIVTSATVTTTYYNLKKETEFSKIVDGERVWHRMGDTGYFDSKNRLWFTGRVAHSFNIADKAFYPIPLEQHFLDVSNVEKVAVVKVSDSESAVILQACETCLEDIQSIITSEDLDINYILFHHKFPVDIRHNIKIDRKALSIWATQRLGL